MDNSKYRVSLIERTFSDSVVDSALKKFKETRKAEDWTDYLELLEEKIKKYYEADNKKDVVAVVVKVSNEKKVFEEDFPVIPDYMLSECNIFIYVGDEDNQKEIKLPSAKSDITQISVANMQQEQLSKIY